MSFFGNRRQVDPAPASSTPKPSVSQIPVSGQQPVGFETVLGANSVMEGTLKSSANIRLDGTFTGTLEITGNVLVGETAKINADIHAKNVSIAGAVRGNVSGKKVQLLRTGRIWGDIQAQALTTEEGAFIDGKITMISREPTPAEPPAPEDTQATSEVSVTKAEDAVVPGQEVAESAEPTKAEADQPETTSEVKAEESAETESPEKNGE